MNDNIESLAVALHALNRIRRPRLSQPWHKLSANQRNHWRQRARKITSVRPGKEAGRILPAKARPASNINTPAHRNSRLNYLGLVPAFVKRSAPAPIRRGYSSIGEAEKMCSEVVGRASSKLKYTDHPFSTGIPQPPKEAVE